MGGELYIKKYADETVMSALIYAHDTQTVTAIDAEARKPDRAA